MDKIKSYLNIKNKKKISVLSFIILFVFTSMVSAWPGEDEWISGLDAEWNYISDSVLDERADYLNYIADPLSPKNTAVYWYYENNILYFRKILDGNPLKYKGGQPTEFKPFGWNVLIESTGDSFADFLISIDGTSSADQLHILYNKTLDNVMDAETGNSVIASSPLYIQDDYYYLIEGYTRVRKVTEDSSYWANNSPDYYIDFKVPLNWLNSGDPDGPPPIEEDTPLKFAFGSGASGQTINKDLVGQSGTVDLVNYFDSTVIITPGNGASRNYGILRDTRHASQGDYGIWHVKEDVNISGQGWPVYTSSYYSPFLNILIKGPGGTTLWTGSVSVNYDGSIDDSPTIYLPSDTPLGVYYIYAEDPLSPGNYNIKDTFTVASVILDNSYKQVSSTTAVLGDRLTYSIYIINNGNLAAEDVIVSDIIPTYTEYVTSSTYVDGQLIEDINGITPLITGIFFNSIQPGQSRQINFSVKIMSATPDQQIISNQVTIIYDEQQLTRSVSTLVQAPKLEIIKKADRSEVEPSGIVTYTTTCNNIGHSPARTIDLIDVIPDNTTYVNGSASGTGVVIKFQHQLAGQYNLDEQAPVTAIKWIRDNLNAGESFDAVFKVKVD